MVQFIAWMILSCTLWPRLVLVDSTNRLDYGLCSRQLLLKLLTMLRELVITWRFDTTSLTGAPHKASKGPVAAVLFVMRNKQPNASKLRPFLWLLLRPLTIETQMTCGRHSPLLLRRHCALRALVPHGICSGSLPLDQGVHTRRQQLLSHFLFGDFDASSGDFGIFFTHRADLQLASNVLRDVRSLSNDFPDLASIDLVNLNSDVEVINSVVDTTASTAKLEAIAHWKARLHDDPVAQASWIKPRAAADLERMAQPAVPAEEVIHAIHPSNILYEKHVKWCRVWNPVHLCGSVEEVSQLLHEVPQPQPLEVEISWTTTALKRATRATQGKVGGADDWRPEDLLLLPEVWWVRFSQLWDFCYQRAALPFAWKLCRVTLARKPTGSYRPICLCSVAWRAGSRRICRSLRCWARSWMGARDLGGLPGCSPADAHGRLFTAVMSGADCFLQEDLATFFDTVSIEHAVQVLLHLRAPPQVAALLKEFYNNSARILSYGGFVATTWTSVRRGLLQGCPLSALVAASVMHVWTSVVADKDTECLAFLDDRTSRPLTRDKQQRKEVMASAAARGRRFDRAFGFSSDKAKSAVGSATLTTWPETWSFLASKSSKLLG